jgi:hypothetical protein
LKRAPAGAPPLAKQVSWADGGGATEAAQASADGSPSSTGQSAHESSPSPDFFAAAEAFKKARAAEAARRETFDEWRQRQIAERAVFFEKFHGARKASTLTLAERKFQRALKKARALHKWRTKMKEAKAGESPFRVRELQRKQLRANRIQKAETRLEEARKRLERGQEPLPLLREMETQSLERFERKRAVWEQLQRDGRTARVLLKARKVQREAENQWRRRRAALDAAEGRAQELERALDAAEEGVRDAKRELPRHQQRGRLLGPGAFPPPSDLLEGWKERFTAPDRPEIVWTGGYFSGVGGKAARGQDPRDYISNTAAILPNGRRNTHEERARQTQENKWSARVDRCADRAEAAQASVATKAREIAALEKEGRESFSAETKAAIVLEVQALREELGVLKEVASKERAALVDEKARVARERRELEQETGGVYYRPKQKRLADRPGHLRARALGRGTFDIHAALSDPKHPRLAAGQSRLRFACGKKVADESAQRELLSHPGAHAFLDLSIMPRAPHPILPEEDVMNFFRWKPRGMDAETKKKMLDLFSCARNGLYDECLQLMQSDGWPLTIDAADDTGNQLLHVAAQADNIRIVKLCAREGADLNAKGFNGNTALHNAMGMRHKKLAAWLRANGAGESMDIANKNGTLPIDVQIEELAPIMGGD